VACAPRTAPAHCAESCAGRGGAQAIQKAQSMPKRGWKPAHPRSKTCAPLASPARTREGRSAMRFISGRGERLRLPRSNGPRRGRRCRASPENEEPHRHFGRHRHPGRDRGHSWDRVAGHRRPCASRADRGRREARTCRHVAPCCIGRAVRGLGVAWCDGVTLIARRSAGTTFRNSDIGSPTGPHTMRPCGPAAA
jgi:hypothetical protein